jgi:hypothetical protein
MADPGQLRQRRLIPHAFQSDPLTGAQGSGTLAQVSGGSGCPFWLVLRA